MESMLRTRRFPAVAALLMVVLPAAHGHAATTLPTVAVMTLEAKAGVSPDAAELVSDRLSASITDAKVFGHVVTNRELESTMGLEAKKQLLDCKSDSCAAEIAAAWAVTHMVTGSVGRLGPVIILNLRLIDVKQGVAVARQSEKVPGGEEALFDAIQPAVTRLLLESGLKTAAVAAPTAPAPPAEGNERSARVSINVDTQDTPVVRYALWGLGGVAGVLAALAVPVVLFSGVTALACGLGNVSSDPLSTGLRGATSFNQRLTGMFVGGALATVALVLLLGLAAAAGGLIAGGVFAG